MKRLFIFLILTVFLSVNVLAADVSQVGDWWGIVTVNGNNADGAIVNAYINNIKVASSIVGAIESDYYLIHVEGNEGDNILFKLNGQDVTTASWSNGDHELDLIISSTSATTLSNSGGSPSSSSSTTTTSGNQNTENTTGSATENPNGEQKTEEQNQQILGNAGITVAAIGFSKTRNGTGMEVETR